MLVSEGQKSGALAVLMLSLLYYGVSFLDASQTDTGTPSGKLSSASIQWGRQQGDNLAIEVRGGRADGIYFVPKGTKLEQIIEIAGIKEDRSGLLHPETGIPEGAMLELSPTGEVTVKEMPAARMLALGLRLDLNRASEEDISLLPGVGDRMAAQIIQLRMEKGLFRDISDLMAVPGIKEKRLNMLKDYLVIR